ncbi:hypothetical protein [Dyadobacter aurulentus]|uniref:hypothetical protein n=1 Tax=Dyadobacter sp. UC 10 TaxID=2605428 RepID=UPI0011F3B12A|nr:hypothetical protein [Dyadobacter sp. UC 10]KAA0991308.1 hypothetical protein FXO21_14625 [Dyadobacter sp. UC 10]
MKKIMVKTIVSLGEKSLAFRSLYCWVKRRASPDFLEIVESRKNLDIFQISELSQPLQYHPLFYIEDCNYYGILYNLLSYSGIDLNDKQLPKHEIYLEHGIVIGSLVRNDLVELARKTLTFSDYRIAYITEHSKKMPVSIGPYIHYAESLLDTALLATTKAQLGKTLLVFPSHSIGAVGVEFDQKEFCKEIEGKRAGFDTILVCLYWKDIQNGAHLYYEKMGYKITTAGHRDDLHFLGRLKSIITLSDMVMSNSTGTQIGYSILLNKPNYLFKQKVSFVSKEKSGDFLLQRHHDPKIAFSKERDNQLLYDAFGNFEMRITENQYNLVNRIWGLDCVKSRENLRDILLNRNV